MDDLTGLVSLSEAAKVLGISRPTLYKWIAEKRLYPIKIGQYRLLFYQALTPFIISKCTTCEHSNNGLCNCREAIDIVKINCPDWLPKQRS